MKQHGAFKMGVKVGVLIQRRNKVKSLTIGDNHTAVLAAPSVVAHNTLGTSGWGLLPVALTLKRSESWGRDFSAWKNTVHAWFPHGNKSCAARNWGLADPCSSTAHFNKYGNYRRGEEAILQSWLTAAIPALPLHAEGLIIACLNDRVGKTQGPAVGWEMADVRAMDPYLWQPE